MIAAALLLSGCASHKPLACRFVAVDNQGNVLKQPTAAMHSHWHKGELNCATMIEALADGFVSETVNGHKAGVEVRGPKEERLKLKRMFDTPAAPQERQGVASVGFRRLMEVAE